MPHDSVRCRGLDVRPRLHPQSHEKADRKFGSEFPVRFLVARWAYATRMDEERAHQRADEETACLPLPTADTPFVAAVRYLVELGRRRRQAEREASQAEAAGSESATAASPR